MVQQFVIVQALGGKPLKRVFITTSEKAIHVADPGLLDEIKSGIHATIKVAPEKVFDFDERVFNELLSQWHASKETAEATWAKLANFQPIHDWVD